MPEETRNSAALNQAVSLLADVLRSAFAGVTASDRAVSGIILDALGTKRVSDDLSELFRLPSDQVRNAIAALGIPLSGSMRSAGTGNPGSAGWICSPHGLRETFSLSVGASSPAFAEPFKASADLVNQLDSEWDRLVTKVRARDPFLSYYRENVGDYPASYLATDSKRIRDFVRAKFDGRALRYLVTVGIGANEQFWHCPRRFFMQDRGDAPSWHIVDNPKDIANLPLMHLRATRCSLSFPEAAKRKRSSRRTSFCRRRPFALSSQTPARSTTSRSIRCC